MLAVAAVPAIEDGNMTVDTADGSSSIPGGQSFDLVINWNLGNPSPYWYGAFALGSNPSNPDNLGWTDVSLKRRPCAGNFNGDSVQDGSDLAIFVQQFGGTDCAGGMYCDGDFDRDRDVDGSNLARFSADTGRTDCPH
jgi:hypothetical protein